jgi:hypothetical protein
MCQHPPALLDLPEGVPDEAIAQLIELLHELARVLENRYAGELYRYYHRDERQRSLWPDDERPF